MGWLKKFKKALGLENKRKIPKQESKPAPKASTRKAAPKYSDRAPNVQKMKAKEAYRAKREVTAHKAVSSMSKGAKQTFKKNTQKSPVQRFNAGLIRGGAMMGLPSTKGMPKTVKNSTAFKAGNVVGTAASYLVGYGAVGGLAKGTVKIAAKSAPRAAKTFAKVAAEKQAGKNLGKVATKDFLKSPNTAKFTAKQVKQAEKKVAKTRVADKLAETKAIRKAAERQVKADEAKAAVKTGKKVVQRDAAKAERAFQEKVNKEATKKAEKVVEKVKQNVIADATVGTALDTAHAKGEGIEIGSKDYAKYMAESAALNVGFGVGSEAFGGVVRGVKALRNGKKLVRLEKDGKIIHRVIGDDERALSGKFSGPEVTEATSRVKAAEKKAEDATEPTVLEATERGKKMPNGNYLVKEDGKTKIVTAKQYNKAQKNLDAMRARTQKIIDRADERERIAGTAIREGKRVSPDAEVMAQASRRKSVAGLKNLDVPEIAANIDKRPGRIAKDGELTRLGEGKVVKTLQQGKDIEAARGPALSEPIKVQGQKGGLKRADLRPKEEREALKAATEDKGFVEKVRKGDINVQEYAKKNNVSMREATIDLHAQYSAIGKDAGDEVSKTASTLHDAPYMTKEQKEAMDSLMDEGMFNKKTQSHKEAFANAKERIDKHGYDSVAETISAKVERGVVFNQDDTADARLCIEHFLATGETKKAEKLMEDVTIAMSEAGRTVQSMRMFMANTPSGKVNLLKRQVKKLSERKGVEIKVDDKYYEAIKNAKTEKEIIEANKAFQKHVWDQVPANWVEKLNAWRYLAMLGNPKTHLRNVFGNVLYVPIRTLDDIISTGIEKATVKQADRTKAILNYASKSDKALLKAADDSWESGTGEMLRMTSEKYLENGTDNLFSLGSRPSDSRIFKTKPVEAASQKNANALDVEDLFFMKRAYKHYYAQFLKAKGITADSITEELAKEAEKYAGERSLKATYRDTNVLADFIRKGKRYASMKTSEIPTTREGREAIAEQRLKKVGGVALEALVPFAKTPANILARGIEHSPVGLVRGMADVVKAKNADEVIRGIERLSAGLTGTGLMGVGVYFGANGLADGSIDYTNKEDKFRQELGKQAYSIRVGDHTVTADWAAPMSMPFFIGVEIGKGRDAEDTLAALSKVQEPLFNLTMLQSLNNALDNQWGDATGITNTAKKIAQSYAGQFLPTVGGQIARTMQEDTSSTLATDENTTVREYNRWKNQLKNKVPGLADTNAPKIDSFGRKETKKTAGDYIKAGILNVVSPANVKEVKNDPVANELLKLKKEGADNSVIPNTKPSEYTVHIKDTDAPLSPKEYTRMQEIAGKESRKKLKELFNSEEYQKMDMGSKEKAISNIYTDAKKTAKVDVLRGKGYSDTDIAWDNYLSSQQRKKYETMGAFEKDLKKAGITARKFEDYADKGATLAQVKKAKERGVDVDTFIGAMQAKKGSKSFGQTLATWIDKGYVKSYDDFLVYDPDAKKGTWNAIVWAKNNNMSTKRIAKVIGTDTTSNDKNRQRIKKYGTSASGTFITPDALHQWIEKEHGDLKRKEKCLMWKYYGYNRVDFIRQNPYL